MHEIRLRGSVPNKKNNLRPRARGKGGPGYMNDRSVKAMMDGLELQARGQWRDSDPLQQADVAVVFFVRDGLSDIDSKFTTVLDVLVKARVIANDNIKRVSRIAAEAVIGHPEESATVYLCEPGRLPTLRLWMGAK